MAERIVRQLIDDLDGTEIADASGERVIFSVRGTTYELDLSATNAAKLDRALKPFIDAAVKARRETGSTAKEAERTRIPRKNAAARGRRKGGRMSKTAARTRTPNEQLGAIRDWARENGYKISNRGRIRSEILEAFEAAH